MYLFHWKGWSKVLSLSVPSRRNDNLDCLENAYASVCRYYNRGFEAALSHTWTFHYNPSSLSSIGLGLETQSELSLASLEEHHGVLAQVHSCKGNEAVSLIMDELHKAHPSVLELKASRIPWDSNYKRYDTPYEHAFITIDWESGTQSFICNDSWYEREGERIPSSECTGDHIPVTTFRITGPESVPDSSVLLQSSLHNFERSCGEQSPFAAMRALSKDLLYTNMKAEFEGYRPLLPPYGPPISNHLYTISNNRKKYSVFLEYLSGFSGDREAELKEVALEFKVLAEKWKIVTGMFYKAFYSGKEDIALIKRISAKVHETARLEEQLFQSLSTIISNGRYFSRYNRRMNPILTEGTPLNLKPWFNNIAFGSLSGDHNADFTGTGEFFVTDEPGRGFVADNISCCGQQLPADSELLTASWISIQGCGEWGCPSESLMIHYADEDTEELDLQVTDWEAAHPLFGEPAVFTGRCAKRENGSIHLLNQEVRIYTYHMNLTKNKPIRSIQLPDCPNLHIFTLSIG